MKEKIWKKVKENWLLIVGAIFLTIFLYSDFFFGDYKLSYANMMYSREPWRSLEVDTSGPVLSDVVDAFIPELYTTIKDGTIGGIWDPHTALGTVSNVSSWLYPLNYIFSLPLGAAVILRAASEFCIAFLGMYLLIRSFGGKKGVAWAAGVTYCFSSVIVLWLGWQHSDVVAFAPLAFFFFEKFLQTFKVKYCFGITLTVYCMLVAGMPTYAAYFLYLMALYVFVHTISKYHKKWKAVAGIFIGTLFSVVLAVMCSLPYTMTLLRTVGSNGYADSRVSEAPLTLSMEYLQAAFFPYNRIIKGIDINESTVYVGLAAIILLFFTFLNYRKKKTYLFWHVAGVVVFLLIFTHSLDFIFVHLPAINSSQKIRIITPLNFILTIIFAVNLNDLIENRSYYLENKGKTLLALCAGTGLCTLVFCFTIKRNPLEPRSSYLPYVCITAFLFFLLLAFLIKKIDSRKIVVLLCVVIAYDMGSFAKESFPLIEKGAEDIPQPTETIKYLQEHTEDERITAVGGWTLFPNTNVYYGLDDIRGHNFVLTNPDMREYYTKLTYDGSGFQSATRFILPEEYNEALLQYMGVKYVVKGIGMSGKYTVIGPVNQEKEIKQEFLFEQDKPQAVYVLLGTYGNTFSEEDKCLLTVTEKSTGKKVYSAEYQMNAFKDNDKAILYLENNELLAGIPYEFTFTTNTQEDKSIAFYAYEEAVSKGVSYNGEEQNRKIAAKFIRQTDIFNKDGLLVISEKEYTERVELADTVHTFSEEEQVLSHMSKKFEKNTANITEECADAISVEEIGTLKKGDTAKITDRTDDRVTVRVSVESPKLLMLNEYYDSDWKVYVNGKEQNLIKTNYLFRGVQVPAGESEVEFRYEPKILYIMFGVMGVSMVVIVIIGIFSKKIQKQMDKLS